MQLTKFKNCISGPVIGKVEAEPDGSFKKGKTILLIDDEALVTDICEMMLTELGHKVLKAYSGSEGIELYEANKNQIDLIISDLNMPEMNGQEVVDNLREMDYNVKVLLSSGGLNVGDEKDVTARGFNGFLKKPYNIDALSEKIDEILN